MQIPKVPFKPRFEPPVNSSHSVTIGRMKGTKRKGGEAKLLQLTLISKKKAKLVHV